MRRRIALKTALVTGLVALLLSGIASGAPQVVVQNNADSGAGSLRQAILDVDPGGTIVIPAGVGEITLTSGRLLIEKSMTIEGAGVAQTEISGGNKSQVFIVSGSPIVTIEGLQIVNGLVNSPGSEVFGGGIEQTGGSLTVADSRISQNTLETGATGFPKGGGVGVRSGATSLTLRNTVVADNVGHGFHSWGGGIYVQGALLTIEGGAVKGNTIEGSTAIGGGVVFKGTQASLSHVAITGNELRFFGTAVLGEGAGLDLEGGTGDVLDGITIARNRALLNDATNENANLRGAGAVVGAAGTSVVNSTIAGNIASAAVNSNGRAVGGGLFVTAPTSLVASTIAANSTVASGTAASEVGGDLAFESGGSATIRDTIVSAGTSIAGSENCFEATAGRIASEGHNIDSLDQCGFHAGGDQVNTDPGLGPLVENGGPVETMALQPGSRAIDAGGAVGAAGCPATDARGVLRPAAAACDVGAFEVATPSATTETASGVGTGGATLAGVATNPDLAAGSVSFQYGTTTAYGSQTAAQQIGATTRGASFPVPVMGLNPGTTYHYREVLTNAVGTAFGTDRTFTTQSPPKPNPPGRAPSAKLTFKDLGGLRFRIHCAGAPCHGNLVATAYSGKHRVAVAKAKLKLKAGATKKVTLKLTRRGKPLVVLPGKLPVVVKATLAGGKGSVPKPLHLKLR